MFVLESNPRAARTSAVQSPCDSARVWRDNHQFGRINPSEFKVLAQEAKEHRRSRQMIDGDTEEALDLIRVQIHSQDPTRTRCVDQVSNKSSGDGNPRLGFSILPSVAVVREDGRDPSGRSTLQRVDDNEKLDQILIHRRRRSLNKKHIAAPDILVHLNKDLAIRKARDLHISEGGPEVLANLFGQRQVGRA